MLKNVVQSIPAYAMPCFLIPKSLVPGNRKSYECVLVAKTNSSNSKGIRWLAWSKMCMSKNNGGM